MRPAWPNTCIARIILTPGASFGIKIVDCCLCLGAVGSDLPKKTMSLHSGRMAPLIYHLCPLMTYSSPSLTIEEPIWVASEDATPGSVIAKHERISALSKGSNHFFFCSGVPYFSNTSILPVSGAEQFIAALQSGIAPNNSAIGAYSSTVNPETSGRKKFQRPLALAFARNSFNIGGSAHLLVKVA